MRNMKRYTIAGALVLVAMACSQRVTPEDEYDPQARERPLVELPASGPPIGGPAVSSSPTASDGAAISGQVVGSELASGALRGGVLFLFVRPTGQQAGPPLAVQRHAGVGLPFAFSIGAADAMIPGVEFPDRVTVSARIDADGDPLTSGEEDWFARSEPVSLGDGGVRLELNTGGS